MKTRSFQPLLWPRRVVLFFIWAYQRFVSPFTPPRCRFYPTCSEYARESISQYGFLRGSVKAARRITRCHPWNPGGYDPVK